MELFLYIDLCHSNVENVMWSWDSYMFETISNLLQEKKIRVESSLIA